VTQETQQVPFSRALRDVSLALGGFIACIGLIVWMGIAQDAQAYVPERPTVELVKMFDCNLLRYTADHCAPDLENQANQWLLSKQPGIRVRERLFASSRDGIFLVIFYEVYEWRKPQPKAPAEQAGR
jgi:hypothetical protein